MGFGRILSAAKSAVDAICAKHRTSAVILSAGNSERFVNGEEVSEKKQFTLVAGETVILRSAEAFENCDDIDEIIVVTGTDDVERCFEMLKGRISKLKCVVPGGSTRQESAEAGLEKVDPHSEFIAVHDGARCLVTPEIIHSVLKQAIIHGAAAAAQRPVDTVKYADDKGIIEDTIDRNKVWLVQTPQIFLANMYRAGIYTAKRDSVASTDDCMMVERLGFKVKLVDCGTENMKITYKNDISVAQAIIERRESLNENN